MLHELYSDHSKVLESPLLNFLASTADQYTADGLLLKEAMYNALGVCVADLFERFDFDAFLRRLDYDFSDPSFSSIFRRRVVILIARWVSVERSPRRLPEVYQIIGSLLQDDSNPGTALQAAFSVDTMINAWEWESEPFERYASGYIEGLLKVLARSKKDSKVRILSAIGLIYEKIGLSVVTRLDLVLDQIPKEWNDPATGEDLLRVALLTLLSRMAVRRKLNSAQGYQIVMPLIAYSSDPNNAERTYLLEEALELWHAILQHAERPDDQLLELVPILSSPSMLPTPSENFAKLLCIAESNFLLFGREDVSLAHLHSLVHVLIGMLPVLLEQEFSHVCKVIELAIQILGTDCVTDDDSWLLIELLTEHQEEAVTTSCVLCLLSRLVILDLSRLTRLWAQSSRDNPTGRILKAMFDHFDDLGQASRRKLCALALAALTTTQHRLFENGDVLAGVGGIWSDALAEVQANAGNDLVYWADDGILFEDIIPDSAEVQRRKQVTERDPVCVIALRQAIRNSTQFVDTQSLGVQLESFMS